MVRNADRLCRSGNSLAAPYVQSAVYARLLPPLDMLKSLGLIWIPGVMAGMMVSGASPIYADIYQFILVVLMLTASGVAGMVVTPMLRTSAVSPAAQLILRTNMRLHGTARRISMSQTCCRFTSAVVNPSFGNHRTITAHLHPGVVRVGSSQ